MLSSSKCRNLLSSSALAVLAFAAASQANAASSGLVGLSGDGLILLERVYDQNSSSSAYYALTNTLTGVQTRLDAQSWLHANALSNDGKTVIGVRSTGNWDTAFVWTGGVFTDINVAGALSSFGIAINANGTAATGNADFINSTEAFYWTKANGARLIDGLGGARTYSQGISGDGSTVIGNSERVAGVNSHAFVWTANGGTVDIDTIFDSSTANLVSYNGSAVAGTGNTGNSTSLFYWTSAGMVDAGNLGGGGYLSAAAMSRDGGVVTGYGNDATGHSQAFKYTAGDTGLTNLGTLGGSESMAYDINADGTVIVGQSRDGSNTTRGFRYTDATGMQTVEQWLAANGGTVGDLKTATAELVSDDGNVIVGSTSDYTTYIARVEGEQVGIIDTAKFLPTVAAVGDVVVQNGISHADTVMFGAQGAPMRNLLSAGQVSVWGTVDGGYDNTENADGGLGLGEFGLGYGLGGSATARLSLGGVYNKQDLDAGGDIKQRGFYVSPEVSVDVGSNVFVTVGGYWGRSSIDTHRGYANGATLDFSDGDTDATTWGAKIRADWLDAVTINNTAITPYTALSYTSTKVDAYTEEGGAFPVSYGEAKDHATIARLGVDFVHPLTDTVRLLAKAEADYQFGGRAAGTQATVAGIDFDLDGADRKNFWVRGGIGAEFDVGGGTASIMVNGTTKGADPDIWVRSNFTVKF
jgi:probable HAF family extracellular repeat protein